MNLTWILSRVYRCWKSSWIRFSPIFQSHLSENETSNETLHRYLDERQEIRSNRRGAWLVEQLVYLCARTKSSFHGNAIPANLRMIQWCICRSMRGQDRFWLGYVRLAFTPANRTATFWRIVFTYICFSFNFFFFFVLQFALQCNISNINLLDFSFRSVFHLERIDWKRVKFKKFFIKIFTIFREISNSFRYCFRY